MRKRWGWGKALRLGICLVVSLVSGSVGLKLQTPLTALAATNQWSASSPSGVSRGCVLEASPAYASDSTVFLVTNEVGATGVYKSVDKGATWSTAATPPSSSFGCALAVSPAYATDGKLFAVYAGRDVYGSSDAGATWSTVGSIGTSGTWVNVIEPSPLFA